MYGSSFLCTNDAISMIQKVTKLCNVKTCKHLIIEIKLLETQDSTEKVKILLRINHLKTNAVKNHICLNEGKLDSLLMQENSHHYVSP